MPDVAAGPAAFDPTSLIRSNVRGLSAYRREDPPESLPARAIRLDWNESPYGPSPKARAALDSFDLYHRYPEIDALSLREALGRYVGAPTEQVVVGAGLDDVLSTLSLMLIEPGDRVVISEPTFGVYRPLFALHGAEVVNVPLLTDFHLNAEAILHAVDDRTKIVVICNPNNPTGNLFDPEAVERVVAEASCLVAIDEAYAEFAGTAHRPLMDRYPNLAVFRTLSKFAGLAGMRVGYGVLPVPLASVAAAVMPAFGNVAAASAVAALASLEDIAYLQDVVARIVAERDALSERLGQLHGVEPHPSSTNFILARLPLPAAAPVVSCLAETGIHVRHFPDPALGLVDCLRVSVGLPEENDIFLSELAVTLSEHKV